MHVLRSHVPSHVAGLLCNVTFRSCQVIIVAPTAVIIKLHLYPIEIIGSHNKVWKEMFFYLLAIGKSMFSASRSKYFSDPMNKAWWNSKKKSWWNVFAWFHVTRTKVEKFKFSLLERECARAIHRIIRSGKQKKPRDILQKCARHTTYNKDLWGLSYSANIIDHGTLAGHGINGPDEVLRPISQFGCE